MTGEHKNIVGVLAKKLTVSIYFLVDREYQVSHFLEIDCIQSLTFPELNLTAEKIFQAVSFEA